MEEEVKENREEGKEGECGWGKDMCMGRILGGDMVGKEFLKRERGLVIVMMMVSVV